MKKINKSGEPSSLTKFKRKNSSNKWEDIHTEQNRSIYEDCLFKCMDDQNYLCGYTEIKLDDNYHIDHFIKRDIDPRQTFDWQNMIASVHDSKFGADFKDKAVNNNDYNKRLKKYNCILNPVTENMENRFIFSTNGVIEPADRNDREAIALGNSSPCKYPITASLSICSNNFLVFSIACFRLLFRESSCKLKTRMVSVASLSH